MTIFSCWPEEHQIRADLRLEKKGRLPSVHRHRPPDPESAGQSLSTEGEPSGGHGTSPAPVAPFLLVTLSAQDVQAMCQQAWAPLRVEGGTLHELCRGHRCAQGCPGTPGYRVTLPCHCSEPTALTSKPRHLIRLALPPSPVPLCFQCGPAFAPICSRCYPSAQGC